MACPALGLEALQPLQPEPPPEPAFSEAQKWIEQVTGRSFGDKDFRTGLENGILLCELLNAIKPGLVKKINRLPTPIAGLDNIILFLRGCKELGLKESQLFDPSDLQDTSNRVTVKSLDYSRKLKNVLVTIYWLGKAANSCTSYSGTTLNLKEFEGLLAQMRKDTDDIESPKRSIRDSGYIDCWDSERSDSLSPPRHGRDDSFDSLDSFGSRSRQTPSPDVVLRGSSDGRGSDSESDLPHRKLPDVKKDDMSARRTSHGEPKSAVPFNQYLPNKSNQTAYVPAPLRKKKAEREEYRKSWSTATSPLGGERPFSFPETIEEEGSEVGSAGEDNPAGQMNPGWKPSDGGCELPDGSGKEHPSSDGAVVAPAPKSEEKDAAEIQKRKRLEQAGIKVMPAAQRFASQKQLSEEKEAIRDIVLRKENSFLTHQHGNDSEAEGEVVCRLPDLEKDDFAARRARMNQTKPMVPLNQLLYGPYPKKGAEKSDGSKQLSKGISKKRSLEYKRNQGHTEEVKLIVTCNMRAQESEPVEGGLRKVPDLHKDDLAQQRIQGSLAPHREPPSFITLSNITEADLETWERLKVSEKARDGDVQHICASEPSPEIKAETAIRDDFANRKARASKKASSPRQKFVHFGPVTELDQQKWKRLSIGKAGPREDEEEVICHGSKIQMDSVSPVSAATSSLKGHQIFNRQNDCRTMNCGRGDYCRRASWLAPVPESQEEWVCSLGECPRGTEEVTSKQLPQDGKEETESAPRDSERLSKAERSEDSSQPLVCPLASECEASGTEEKLEKMTAPAWSGSGLKGQRKLDDSRKDDMMARRTGMSLRHTGSNPNQFLPVPFAKQQDVEESSKGLPMKDQRYGPRTPVSDDAESTSMFDMRCEEEAAVQPHSRARQEQLQLINNQLREEDDKWQDDLARWKSRRRSVSQDLIKKEEERKKMEKLLAGEDGTSERRKSIKTYREIVQEKERRERELHEAYKNARSQEEAEGILQQYIERFTISEAVLERLEMPKILERSHSTEPNLSSFLNDPNPMKYLRQQSLPPPKFTATVETTIARASVLDTSMSAGSGSPSKTVTPKAVPMLTPKPYSQPKNSQDVLKTFKVDGKVSVNGETVHREEEKERECPTVAPAHSLTKSQMFEGVARVHGSPLELKQDNGSIEINIKKPNSVPQELAATTEKTEPNSQEDKNDGGKSRKGNIELASSEPQHFTTTVTRCSPTVAFVEFPSSPQLKNDVSEEKDQKKPENEMSGKVELVLSQKVVKPKSPEPEATLTFPFLDKMPEANQLHLPNLNSQVDSPSSEKSPVMTPQFKFWAWDPEEERRRQEKWQQEQERLLQERYQKEQDKLKEEWEKAQKEVEEEERRYYEEERKIIEDTVVPFTVSSSSADQLSTSSSMTEGSGTMNKIDLGNCQDEKQDRRWKKSFQGDDSDLLLKTRESDRLEEKGSLTEGALAHSGNPVSKGVHEDHQLDTEAGAPHCGTNPQLAQDPSQNQQTSNPTHSSEDVKPKTLPLDKSINHQIESPSERRKKSPREHFQAGPFSPCSPTPPGQSPNRYKRSISGKKLCSSCGLPLGKGAAMIIETLNLYFHIQCFRCGICKGQLGDAVSGTDVRIRNGLLNCNDCYMRSRSAGQPTTL
ncbi:LIM and calponin homology domains-containing protein 1 isoform X5 [Homo sapiens]|uniref:LIM and calponin homology domains-containing protein 1 isoform X5 n=1 Tax=Homo sapiens TaxID=9606 RepID=UPI000387AF12|nr:LIM and calponin homology domains-containing protein 1 isoform X5 [Homo sapiens]XP_054205261.1 LIM and calponin homology domains-containing protein 1 isoform X5 [Homo sapiens]|eukprot:XP_005248114.1 LIM and calponin homology domains-containing protein 1 isoform X5 [Homo sapiens]